MHTHNYTFCHSHTQYTHDSHTSTPTYLHTPSHTPIPSHSRTYPHQCTHPHTLTHVLTHAYSHVQFCQKCTKATSTSFGFAKETRLQRHRKKISEKNFVKRKEMSGGKLTLIKFWAFFKLSFFSHFFGLAEDLCLTFWAEKNNVCFPVEAFLLVSTLFVFLAFEMVLKGILNW